MIISSKDCLFPQLFNTEYIENFNPITANPHKFKTSNNFKEGKFSESEEKNKLKEELLKLKNKKVIIISIIE